MKTRSVTPNSAILWIVLSFTLALALLAVGLVFYSLKPILPIVTTVLKSIKKSAKKAKATLTELRRTFTIPSFSS